MPDDLNRLIEACRTVIDNYDLASAESYDELCWGEFDGVDPIRDLLAEIAPMHTVRCTSGYLTVSPTAERRTARRPPEPTRRPPG